MLLLPVAECPAGSLTEPREYGGYNTYVSNSTHTDSKPPWLENVTSTCPPATLRESLEARTVDELKRYLKILSDGQTKPGRKAELVADVRRYCKGAALRNLWEQLDELEQAAIAEAAHDPDRKYDADLFDAKYGGELGTLPEGVLGVPTLRSPICCLCSFMVSICRMICVKSSNRLYPSLKKRSCKLLIDCRCTTKRKEHSRRITKMQHLLKCAAWSLWPVMTYVRYWD